MSIYAFKQSNHNERMHMSDTPGSHGAVGRREGVFIRLFEKRLVDLDADALKALATQMIGNAGDAASNSRGF